MEGCPRLRNGFLFGLSAALQQNRQLFLAAAQSRFSLFALDQIDCCNQNEGAGGGPISPVKRHTNN